MISDYYEDVENDSTPKLRPVRRNRKVEYSPGGTLPPRVEECFKQTVCPLAPLRTVPIVNIDGYIRDTGMSGEKEELYRKLYTVLIQEEEPESIKEVEKQTFPDDMLHVFSNLKVLKNGTVRIKFTVPMEPVYTYQMKQKTAPIDVRLRAAKGFGYPDEVLEKMLINHDRKKINIPKLDNFIDNIFGKAVSAKASKPKSKTTQELLNSKFKKKTAKKYS